MMSLHNHTTYSDGKLTPVEVVEAALAAGMGHVAITDHFATQKVRSVRQDELGQYVASIKEIASRYTGKIRVLAGVEIDASPKRTDFETLPYEQLGKLDFVLLEYVQDQLWGGMDLWEILPYRRRLACHVGLAHNDIGKNFRDTNSASLVNLLESHEIFVELCSSLRNSKFGKPYYRYAEQFFRNAGGRVAVSIGTDAHHEPAEVCDVADAVSFVKEMGLENSLVTQRYWK